MCQVWATVIVLSRQLLGGDTQCDRRVCLYRVESDGSCWCVVAERETKRRAAISSVKTVKESTTTTDDDINDNDHPVDPLSSAVSITHVSFTCQSINQSISQTIS